MGNLIRNRSNASNFLEGFWDIDRLDDFASSGNKFENPAINIVENDDKFIIEVGAPGLKKDDYEVNIDNDKLIISGQKKNDNPENEEEYARREFNYAEFKRTFRLPNSVDTEQISARCEDGILFIRIPKKQELTSGSAKKIEVN